MQYEINDLKSHIVWINRNFFDLTKKFKIVTNENEKLQQENESLADKLKTSEKGNNDYKQTIEELLQAKNKLLDESTQNFRKAKEVLHLKNQLICNLEVEIMALKKSIADNEEGSRRSVAHILSNTAITCAKYRKTIEIFEMEKKDNLVQVQNLLVENTKIKNKWAAKSKIHQEQLDSLRGEVLSVKDELAELKQDAKVKDEKITELKNQLDEKIKMENLLATKVKVKHEELVLLDERSIMKDKELALLLQNIQIKDKQLEKFIQENENKEELLYSLREQVKSLSDDIEDAQQQITIKNNHIADIAKKLNAKDENFVRLSEEMDYMNINHQEELKKKNKEIMRLKSDLKEKRRRTNNIMIEANEFRRNAIKADKSNKNLFNQTVEAREFLERALEFLNHLTAYIKRKENHIFSFRRKLSPESTKKILSWLESCLNSSVAAMSSVADMQTSTKREMQSCLEAMGWLPKDTESCLEI